MDDKKICNFDAVGGRGGRNSQNFDFDAWQGKTKKFKIKIIIGDPSKITINILHTRRGRRTRWYSDLKCGTIIPNPDIPKYTPHHDLFVSGSRYSGLYSPGSFWIFACPLAVKK
ncbi:MAG: hypothetical protein ACW963_06500 [Candidatus Sifarchaeia archaeon]